MNYNSFKTMQRADPLFEDFLWGAGEHLMNKTVPLPVKTLNLGEPNETVTFQVFTEYEIKKPKFLNFFSALIKLHTYILILMPLLYVLVKNFVDNRFRDPFSISFSALAMLFLYAGLNIRNDILDHIYGFDRVNILKSNKPIALGWITAIKASRLSWAFVLAAAVISIPAFYFQAELIRVFAVVFVLFFLGQFVKRNAYKYNRFGEIILFLLAGPGLASGYQVSLGAGVDTEILAFGVLWGFAILFLIHINNFSHILTSSQAGISNTITRMGFDKAQNFLVIWWSIFCLLWLVFHYLYASLIWTIFGTLLLVLWSLPLFVKIYKIKSPLGSDLDHIRKEAYKTFLMMVFILFAESFWYLGDKINWTL
jgi:1,4-dihydroxy-2-naphthoate octaprenyltransferase